MPSRQPAWPALPSALALLLLLGENTGHQAHAHPYAKDDLHDSGFGYLMDRDCSEYCGYNNQYCCSPGSTCYTSAGIAGCTAASGGGYAFYTTTWTEAETFTSTYSSLVPAATAAAGQTCTPPEGSGQIACGNICCASWQYCAYSGQCAANPGADGDGGGGGFGASATGAYHGATATSDGQTLPTPYSAPYRVTSGGAGATATGTAAGGTSGSATLTGASTSPNLSGGAIAGIVIGALVGVAILVALCMLCIVRGLWHGVLAIFGLGPDRKRRTETTIIEEERYTRRGESVRSRRDHHDSRYGDVSAAGAARRTSAAARTEKPRNENRGSRGLGAAAGTLMLLLGLRRDQKRRQSSAAKPPRSEVTSTYYTDSYTATTPSEYAYT